MSAGVGRRRVTPLRGRRTPGVEASWRARRSGVMRVGVGAILTGSSPPFSSDARSAAMLSNEATEVTSFAEGTNETGRGAKGNESTGGEAWGCTSGNPGGGGNTGVRGASSGRTPGSRGGGGDTVVIGEGERAEAASVVMLSRGD